MDEEFLQFAKEMGFYDLLDINEKNIIKIKNTFFYKKWRLGKAWSKLIMSVQKTKLINWITKRILKRNE
jgi:hypothetical protein